jgi:hypothetical protein
MKRRAIEKQRGGRRRVERMLNVQSLGGIVMMMLREFFEA